MFQKRFYTLLEHDIMDFAIDKPSNPHHRVAIRGIDRKTQTQIPEIHKSSGHPTERKILMIKNSGGSQPCDNNDLQYIISKYKINNTEKPRMLGKTGVTLMKTQHGNFIITR